MDGVRVRTSLRLAVEGDLFGRGEVGANSGDGPQVGSPVRDRFGWSTGVTTDERQRLKDLERENCELRRANEFLKSASAFFAAELDGQRR